MRLVPETLGRHLSGALVPAWLISADEPLLAGECADAIRAKARAEGYANRQVVFADRGFDWGVVEAETRSLSLFAERRLLEIRLTSKPLADGARVLVELATKPAPDLVVLVLTDKLEWADKQAAWVKAFETGAHFVDVEQLLAEQLPGWIEARLRRAGLVPDAEAVALLAERCEGNLVSAHQEIERLALACGPGPVDAHTVAESVADTARFHLFQLGEAALAGDLARTVRVLDGLEAEGEGEVLVLWSLAEEIRACLQWSPRPPQGAPKRLFRGGRRRQALLERAARRLPRARLRELLLRAAHADAVMKGARRGDRWSELRRLATGLAGLEGWPARATR